MFPTAVQNDNSLLKEVVRGLFELTFSNAFRYMPAIYFIKFDGKR
jgi:hypothetical protein